MAEKTHELRQTSDCNKLHKSSISPIQHSAIQQVLQVISMIFPRYIHYVHGISTIFSMLFVFCTCRAHKLAEKQTIRKSGKNWVTQNPLFTSLQDTVSNIK